jgi:hypothetical protein
MHAQQANFCAAELAAFKPEQFLITWYCEPDGVTQML